MRASSLRPGTLAARLVIVGALLASCSKKEPTTERPPPVAHLRGLQGEVQHRPAGSLAWGAGRAEMPLVPRDAVKTGRRARAAVVFLAGGRLDLDEQTLIIVEAPPAPAAKGSGAAAPRPALVRVERGTVHAAAQPGVPLEIATKDGRRTRVEATSQPVRLRLRTGAGGRLEIAALEGAARVTAGGKTVALGVKQALSVEQQGVGTAVALPSYPSLLAPSVDARLAAGAVELTWQPVDGAARYHVQVARTVDFGEVVREQLVSSAALTVPQLAPGPYVWRVSAVSSGGLEGEFGFARRFVVAEGQVAAPPAHLLAPAAGAKLSSNKRRAEVTFRWKPLPAAGKTRYELVVSTSPKLVDALARVRSKKTTRSFTLPAGSYHWGVYAIDGKVRRPLFGAPYELTLIYVPPPRVHIPKSIDRWR